MDRVAVGEPCSEEEETLCDMLCLLDLPNGMCSRDCSENDDRCPDGFVCDNISDGHYCLQECDADEECRDGMLCVVGSCRLPVEPGMPCEEAADCASEVCYEGTCNVECHDPADCEEGMVCINVGIGLPTCAEHDPPDGGEGRYGENCTYDDCDDDFVCMARTDDPADDPYAYCTTDCLTELDCTSDMTCRRTQRAGFSENRLRCVPREYCESCAYDAQCGTGTDRCVSEAPPSRGRYCSSVCDPEREVTSCDTDSTCHEAFWCAADRSWVPDCDWCSDEDACDAPDDPIYQCFHDYGMCAGQGEDYCSPCWVDGDCPRGGHCVFERYSANSFCTAPCEDQSDCPYEHRCLLDEGECRPRAGSCSHPSGGRTTCYTCDGFFDCVSGECMADNIVGPGTGRNVCWEDCSEDPDVCPDYTECHRLTGSDGTEFFFCGPADGMRCSEVTLCQEECPEGPDSCGSGARDYCY